MAGTVNVIFGLGPASGLGSRTLTVTRMHRAGDDSAPSAEHSADAGSTATVVSVSLPADTLWQAKLVDVLANSGGTSRTKTFCFATNERLFPGPRCSEDQDFRVLSIEDNSSSSSVSSSSSHSSSSSSSHSSSSLSSSSSPSSNSSSSSSSSSTS